MENIGGALGFQATLDIDDFNVSAQAMERRIQQVTATARAEGAEMEGVFGRAAQAFAGIVGIGAAKSFVQQMIQVRSEMQNTEASFKVFLGTASKAEEFFSELQRYAYNNVFEFADLSKQAAQLLAFRNSVEDVIPILDRLSNIAAGANAPLGEFVSLFNKAKANNKMLSVDIQMWESRGVPIVYELAQAYGKSEQQIRAMVTAGQVGFKDLETALARLTDRGGMFAGMMQEKMKTLGDSIGLLQDNITNMFNELGKSNQGVLKSGIDLANQAVENYDKLGRMLGALVIGYGTYKAAVIATSLANKSGTGIAVLDNTVRSLKLKLLKAEATLSGQVEAAHKRMNAAEAEHLATLQAELSAEERAAILKQMRVAAIQSLLTSQQQEYLSNLNLTTSSTGYEAAAMGVLTVEQKQALNKMDLSEKSAVYKAALEQEVNTKRKALAVAKEETVAARERAQQAQIDWQLSRNRVAAAQQEVEIARAYGDATRITAAEKKLESAVDNEKLARSAAIVATSDLKRKKKNEEAIASGRVATANTAEAATEIADATAKNVNTAATGRLVIAIKSLWAVIKANPLGWIISILGTVISLVTMFRKKTEEEEDVATEFTNTVRKETSALRMYIDILENAEKGSTAYADARQKLNTICKQYNVALLEEGATIDSLEAKYNELTEAINKTAKAKILSSRIELINRDASETEDEALKALKKQARKAKRTEYTVSGEDVYTTTYKSQNIRAAEGAGIWDAVAVQAKDAAQNLKDKYGKEYTQEFERMLGDILARIKRATGASEEEMAAFAGNVRKYLTTVVEAEKEVHEQVSEATTALDSFYKASEGTGAVELLSVAEYAQESFANIKTKIEETKAELERLSGQRLNLDFDWTKWGQLNDLLNRLEQAQATKTSGLNTETDINARIKELREERSNVEIGSAKYRELSSEITKLQNKLPKTYESIAQKRQAFNDKVLAAQRELEEAQVDLIEDGVAKQERALELQHQRNLDRIQKERTELIKSKKAAGKGSTLSKEEEAVFTERTEAENKAYERQQMKLVDEEIAYKKSQYELYWKWVAHVGKEAADTQFAQLLEGGSSFADYVSKEMAKLTTGSDGAPRSATDRTEGENNRLLAFSVQQDQITGAKSAMDLYTESLSHALEQAGSLAEKIAVIADYQERLQSGEFHLNEDETATATADLNQKGADYEREVNDTLLSEFQTYEEQRLAITQKYATLRAAAEAEGNQERINLVNKGETEALSALNAQMLMQTESWQNLFADLDNLTIEQIDKLVTEIQEKMATADMNLNPADMKAVLDRLDEAKAKILNTNPFTALGKAFKAVFNDVKKGSKDAGDSTKRNWKNLAEATDGCFDFVTDAIDSCDVLGDMIGENGKATIAMIQGVAAAGVAMAAAISSAEKGSVILTAISIALQAIQWIASLFDNNKDIDESIERHQRNIDQLERSFDRLQEAFNKTYWVYSDEERKANEQRVANIKAQIEALEQERLLAIMTFDPQRWATSVAEIERLTKALKEAQQQGDMFELLEYQKENLKQQQKEIEAQIKDELSRKNPDSEVIQNYKNAIEDIDIKIQELEADMLETLAGTDVKSAIDEFGDAIWDAVVSGEDAVKSLGDTIKDTLRNAVKEALKRQYLAKGISEAVDYLGHAMEDSVLSDTERENFEALASAAGNKYREMIEALGDWVKDEGEINEDALTGAARNISEETGSILAGRMNAVIINQTTQLGIIRQQLEYQAQIASQTKRIDEIADTLKRIENSGSSLLSQGIS